MTADVCPTDYFCNQCGSDRKDKKHISIWSGLPCDNQWHDQPAPTHVCVPVEDAKHIERYKWLRNKETFAAAIDRALLTVSPWQGTHYRSVEGMDEAIDAEITEYAKIMLAVSKGGA